MNECKSKSALLVSSFLRPLRKPAIFNVLKHYSGRCEIKMFKDTFHLILLRIIEENNTRHAACETLINYSTIIFEKVLTFKFEFLS